MYGTMCQQVFVDGTLVANLYMYNKHTKHTLTLFSSLVYQRGFPLRQSSAPPA